MGMKMKSYKKLMLLCLLMILFFPSGLIADSSNSDGHAGSLANEISYPPALHSAESQNTPKEVNPNVPVTVIDIGYGWSRVIAPDGSSEISSSGTASNPKYVVTKSSPGQPVPGTPAPSSSISHSTPTPARVPAGSTVKYQLPPGSKKSKAQVKCQTRYDPATGKWVVRYVVVFVMESQDAKVQKVTKDGAIAYVNIDKKGHGVDVIQ
jgi:hypothetical protein